MSKYENMTSYEKYTLDFMKKHENTFEKLTNNPIKESLSRQESLFQNALNSPVRSMLEEQRKTMQRNLTPTLNILKQQEAILNPIRVSILDNLTPPLSGLNKLNQHKTTMGLIGETLKQQRMMVQNNMNLSLGLNVLKQHESVMGSIGKMLKQQRSIMQDTLTPALGLEALKQLSLQSKNLYQSNFDIIAKGLQLNRHPLPKPYAASMLSSLSIKEIYESAVHDLEELYEDVLDEENFESDIDNSVKQFLQEFIAYCKKIRPLLNTLNTPALWDLLHKIATVLTIYSFISGMVSNSEADCDIDDVKPIEEQKEYDNEIQDNQIKEEYENKKEIDKMDIDAGMRT